jgi:hypothetical protein
VGAECVNKLGTFECVCPPGYQGDPYQQGCSPALIRCAGDNDCGTNEVCIQPGQCVCPPPYYSDTDDGNKCKSPCERFFCGMHATCSPSDPPQCLCDNGYEGNPNVGCVDVSNRNGIEFRDGLLNLFQFRILILFRPMSAKTTFVLPMQPVLIRKEVMSAPVQGVQKGTHTLQDVSGVKSYRAFRR